MLIEVCPEFRWELETPGRESTDQSVGHRLAEQPAGKGSPVPSLTEITDFVFDLRHQHGLVRRILLANMMHQGGKRPAVAPTGLERQSR